MLQSRVVKNERYDSNEMRIGVNSIELEDTYETVQVPNFQICQICYSSLETLIMHTNKRKHDVSFIACSNLHEQNIRMERKN